MGASNGGKKVIPTSEQEAKAACYYMEDGETLAIPGWNLSRSLVQAAKAFAASVS
jgi:hypothetical protein